jgi:hypothetical protein
MDLADKLARPVALGAAGLVLLVVLVLLFVSPAPGV